jgi:hypothetical protein
MSIETVRTILEFVYFGSAPIIAIIAIIGLRQLKIAKETVRISAKREAIALAATQCQVYGTTIIPLHNLLDDAIAKNGITIFKEAEVVVEKDRAKVKFPKGIWHGEQISKIAKELAEVLNSMESFSVYFISGVADEQVAFSTVGATFCFTVRKLLPVILLHVETGHFKNIFSLFLMWNARIERENLLRQKGDLDTKLGQINNKYITPIGTE